MIIENTTKPVIGYVRVSTKRQGASGLGLEAQESALGRYATSAGAEILRTYREVETGKNPERPELARAMAHAKRSGATLVIAKMDRLSRNAAFLLRLQDSGLDFRACDNPHANKLTVGILAVVAQHEAEQISERTKVALAAYKARGGVLGASRPECRNLTDGARRKGSGRGGAATAREARGAYMDLVAEMEEWRSGGASFREIAKRLNEAGHTTRRGKAWVGSQVMRVLGREVLGREVSGHISPLAVSRVVPRVLSGVVVG